MGMAASQSRFLQLTGRQHDICRSLQHLSMEKMALTRDMQAITKEYQAALSSKTLKWSNNMGVSYTDISYSTLMRPNSYNQKSPIMVSDNSGRIVLDNKYKKYAEMLDEAGGEWKGDIRTQILSELTGIPKESIDNANKLTEAAATAANTHNAALEALDIWKAKESRTGGAGTKYLSLNELAKNLGTVNGRDLSELYSKGDKDGYIFSSSEDLKSLAEGIKNNMSKYFVDDEKYLNSKDKTAFEQACDAFVENYSNLISNNSENADQYREQFGLKSYKALWSLDISSAFKFIMSAYVQKSGTTKISDVTQETTYPLRHTDTAAWQNWYNELKNKQAAVDNAKSDYDSSMKASSQVMTADQETMLNYYDLLFQTIADNGWTHNYQVEDSEYLNQMLQNNDYYLTTIEKNKCYDSSQKTDERNTQFYYDTTIASNFENLFMVNDSDARNDALVDYEYKKGIISSKEERVDVRMKNLESENAAISKMLESIDKVKSDNIERTFGIWS